VTVRKVPWWSLAARPWKSGGGTTREIAVSPANADLETFDWRVSLADVDEPGPFSSFPGVDRVLVLTHGHGLLLRGVLGALALDLPGDLVTFSGEDVLTAALDDGPTRDFNLFWRRDWGRGSVRVIRGIDDVPLSPGTHLLHAPGTARLILRSGTQTEALGPGDSLVVETDEPIEVTVVPGPGTLVLAASLEAHP
jgi:environmental stress-induced protein Ves